MNAHANNKNRRPSVNRGLNKSTQNSKANIITDISNGISKLSMSFFLPLD